MRVLIVDDSKMMRMMHHRSLRQDGFEPEVLEAGTGEEALKLFDPDRLDLVIVDWNMPGMDGVQFVRAAREMEKTRSKGRTPIVMVTSQSTEEQVSRARDAGVDSVLVKPLMPGVLAATLEMLLPGAAR